MRTATLGGGARARKRAPDLTGELAEAIGVSPAAIRLQLAGLEEEGLVEYRRMIRGVGKPVHVHRLTRDGEGMISRVCLPLSERLLRVLSMRLTAGELEALMREVGRTVALGTAKPGRDRHAQVRSAAALIESPGGVADVEITATGATLHGQCCPVAALAAAYPQVCAAVEALVSAHSGLPLRERCDRSDRPSCRFEATFSAPAADAALSSENR